MTTVWIVLGAWVVCSIPVALILARLFRRPRHWRPDDHPSPGAGSPGDTGLPGDGGPPGSATESPENAEFHRGGDESAPRRRPRGI